MAIMIFSECGYEVSDKAPSCPHCGVIYQYKASPWQAVSIRLKRLLNIVFLASFVLLYAYFAGVEFIVAQNDSEMVRGLVFLSFMTEGSSNFIRDGYFWNDKIFLLLVDSTYYGFAFGQGAAVSVPAVQATLQSMYGFVLLIGLVSFLILLSAINFIFGR